MRVVLLLITLVLIAWAGTVVFAQDSSAPGGKRPLDLPAGGKGDDEEEEDAPESITFYGTEYEGDGFFWCLDKSGSMQGQNRMAILKQECTQAIVGLSPVAELSLVAFSTNMIIWSPVPRRADRASKTSAVGWVQSLNPGGWTCLAPAGVETVNISNMSTKSHKVIIILSDGAPLCYDEDTSEECLVEITAANWQGTPINTISIGGSVANDQFMTTLAEMNGGFCTIIN